MSVASELWWKRPLPPRHRFWALVCAFLVLAFETVATIAIPTDLPTMVRKADLVFTGKVVGQKAEWADRNGRKSIVTIVSFEVLETHKGAAGAKVDLRCPGGTIGDTTLEMVGMPSFKNGEKCVLFARTNANAVCPIVGIYHGKLLVTTPASGGDETLARHNGRPLNALSEIGKDDEGPLAAPALAAAAQAGPVKLKELKARIAEEAARANSAQGGK